MPTSAKPRSFVAVLWAGVTLLVAYVCGGPIVQGLWATYRWEKVPVQLVIWDGTTYVYDYDGRRYYSTHLDFWHWDRAGIGRDVFGPELACGSIMFAMLNLIPLRMQSCMRIR